jgi:hypothetical protein
MTAVAIVFLLFVVLGLAARRWGADTRVGRDWEPAQTPALDWVAVSAGRH